MARQIVAELRQKRMHMKENEGKPDFFVTELLRCIILARKVTKIFYITKE